MKILTRFGFTLETSTFFGVGDTYQFDRSYLSWSDKKLFAYTIEQTKKYCDIDLTNCLLHVRMQQSTDQRYLSYACVYELPTQIIVSIRGSSNRGDMLTDLDALPIYVEELDGKFHRGFYRQA